MPNEVTSIVIDNEAEVRAFEHMMALMALAENEKYANCVSVGEEWVAATSGHTILRYKRGHFRSLKDAAPGTYIVAKMPDKDIVLAPAPNVTLPSNWECHFNTSKHTRAFEFRYFAQNRAAGYGELAILGRDLALCGVILSFRFTKRLPYGAYRVSLKGDSLEPVVFKEQDGEIEFVCMPMRADKTEIETIVPSEELNGQA